MSSSAESLASASSSSGPEDTTLRHRHAASTPSAESLRATSERPETPGPDRELNANPCKTQKTLGRTPDGTVFVVPATHDMVSELLDPRQPKNLSDLGVILILALHVLAAYGLPARLKRPVFAGVFLLWRAAYNLGIGLLLNAQSNRKLLVTWARRWRLFENPKHRQNPRPRLYALLKRELEAKVPIDYRFEEAPIEYNTWLVFRRLVDLILMCDFTSYCLFAVVCGHRPEGEFPLMTAARWLGGLGLVGFNLWVKLDAHRVVKDYAWYWGDFFYFIDQELTFDGVFEMAPHPMYSIGYAGYYGISMMAASYDVLFISILAHAAQFAFLALVENPHIEKTYNPPPPRISSADSSHENEGDNSPLQLRSEASGSVNGNGVGVGLAPPAVEQGGLFCPFRATDYLTLLAVAYLGVLTLSTPSTRLYQVLFVGHAVLWRLWFSVGLGIILARQSQGKQFTRHFLKYGKSANEAWRQWKGLYRMSVVFSYASFIAACWKMYTYPSDWNYDWGLLKHVIGAALLALQLWTSQSIYESLGEFGWYYGDFFVDRARKLNYTSIYRYLNNPERALGTAGLWGAAFITWSRVIFSVALLAQLLTMGFVSYVEKPHMQKIYGRQMRDEAGLTKFVKRSLPSPVRERLKTVDKALDETKHVIDEFVDVARAKLAAGSSSIVKDTTALFNNVPARLTITRIAPDLAGYDPKYYVLHVQGTQLQLVGAATNEKATGKESETARVPKAVKTKVLEYGSAIRVQWTAPANHSKRDWIGLYMVTDNRSRNVTEVSSLGRWVPTCPGEWDESAKKGVLYSDMPVEKAAGGGGDAADLVQGWVVFEGDKLWWTQGTFEFRYHHDGGHKVLSVSEPFEVRIGRLEDAEEVDVDRYAARLLPIVRNCFDRDPEIAPATADEPFGGRVEREGKYAKRVVYAIRELFGIEFASAVVPADGNVRNLAWRICNAKQVLAPYSMSPSLRGPTTPTTDKFS